MIWFFLSTVLVLATYHEGFRKVLAYTGGIGIGLLGIVLVAHCVSS